MRSLHLTQFARQDLSAHFLYLFEQADPGTADRFFTQVEHSFSLLQEQPLLGAVLSLSHPEVQGIRKWHVHHFDRFLIFYRVFDQEILIVRILLADQEWDKVLQERAR